MTSTCNLNIINLQVEAEAQIAIDKANGTYDANIAANGKYYLWQSEFQTLPTGMCGQPELYAARLRESLPEVTTTASTPMDPCTRTSNAFSSPPRDRASTSSWCRWTAPRRA